jgi:hypothetical protein
MVLVLRSAIALLVVLVIGGATATSVAADALPGESLYPIKRAWENARLFLTVDDEAHQELEDELAGERIQEIQELIRLGRQETVTFANVVQAMDNQTWQIGGLLVRLDDKTEFDGQVSLGWKVEVQARIQNDGTLKALRVRVQTGPEGPHHSPYPGPGSTHRPMPSSTDHPSTRPRPGQNSTSMPMPNQTSRSMPMPTDTSMPMPSHTSIPMPTDTSMPMPSHTSMPMPTDTSMPMPTDTPRHTPMASHTPRHK